MRGIAKYSLGEEGQDEVCIIRREEPPHLWSSPLGERKCEHRRAHIGLDPLGCVRRELTIFSDDREQRVLFPQGKEGKDEGVILLGMKDPLTSGPLPKGRGSVNIVGCTLVWTLWGVCDEN